jgi:NAD(P)-dependent dehydrogenase (short-subunit alcohol dehydrogenase family)
VADISQRDRCRETIATAVDEFGGVDVLVNVAGIIRMNNFVDVTEAELDLMMGVNLYGSMWLCQAAIPHLLERSGNIVNIASNAGLMGQAYCSVYASSKAAVINFTRSLAMEYVKTPIRVNCVAPGGTQTPMATQMNFPEGVDFKLVERYMGFRRLADPALVANAILFVASDEAAAVHGSIFSVDSGITAG